MCVLNAQILLDWVQKSQERKNYLFLCTGKFLFFKCCLLQGMFSSCLTLYLFF